MHHCQKTLDIYFTADLTWLKTKKQKFTYLLTVTSTNKTQSIYLSSPNEVRCFLPRYKVWMAHKNIDSIIRECQGKLIDVLSSIDQRKHFGIPNKRIAESRITQSVGWRKTKRLNNAIDTPKFVIIFSLINIFQHDVKVPTSLITTRHDFIIKWLLLTALHDPSS